MRKWIMAALCILALAGCGDNDRNNEDNPFRSDTTAGDPRLARMSLAASQYTVLTDNSDMATVTVTALDQNNAALADVPVAIRASAGLLSAAATTTGADGTAAFTFRAGPEKANQVVTLTVASGDTVKTVPMTITGTTLSLNASKTSLLASDTQGIAVSGQIRDAGGTPLFGEELILSSNLGNTLSATAEFGGTTSGPIIVLTTNVDGEFQAGYSGDVLGQDTVTVKGGGAQKDVLLTVKDTRFGFVDPAQDTSVPVASDDNDLRVQWEDDNGPVEGQILTFSASHGGFAGESAPGQIEATTDSQGRATVRYIASNLATPATIQVSSSTGLADFLRLNVLAVNPSRLDVQAFPTVLPPSVGIAASTSDLVATVRDASNNPVQGARVNFQLIAGPGGGESISPLAALTDTAGQATAVFTAGSLPSAQNGVQIRAATSGLITDDASDLYLTIGQKAARIVIGTTNRLEIIERDGIEVAYGMPVTVLVTDNNGNPIADQKINLGIHPVRFKSGHWERITDEEMLGDDPPHSQAEVTAVFENEDRNRNGILDAGEDDVIVNGQLDPGNVASIPQEVITDEYGLASYKVVYAKSFAVWTDVELSAFTVVSGSEAKTKTERSLPWLADENGFPVEPVINSPFGF
ncbi:MAG: Ig-like domain-containing protein [Desulfuromonadales bacterium]